MSEQVNTSPFQLFERYPDEEAARFYFEKRRWNCLVVCPHCGCDSRISARTGNRIGYYRCGACNKEFTVRRDTILERSRIPLHKWLHAMARAITMGKNVSLVQFGKDVGVSPKTALAILDRLHEACGDDANPKVTSAVEENDALHMSQKNLDRMTDKVFAYNPNAKSNNVLGVIAGAPDKPLVIGEIEIPCYVLENEERVLTQSGMFSSLGLARRGLVPIEGGARIPRFAASKAIKPFISQALMHQLTNPIRFSFAGKEAYGFPAKILPEICRTVLEARRKGSLDRQQQGLAERCEILIQGLATVGIIALVDEATGYQRIREERALSHILERFVAKELQPWTRTFPFVFYEEICRLKRWPSIYSVKRPAVIGRYTNDFVYERLAPGVLEELKRKNPVLPNGYRRHKHHQWFTPDLGHPKLREHLSGVIALMRISSSWYGFKKNLQKAYPKPDSQLYLDLDIPGED